MTTIEEMDEFFNFEDAAQPLDHHDFNFNDAYDIDLALEQLRNGDLSHVAETAPTAEHPPRDITMNSPHGAMDASDYMDFPRWIEGMNVPDKPCTACLEKRMHCKAIKESKWQGSCTNCVARALGKSCSLRFRNEVRNSQYDRIKNMLGDICIPAPANESAEQTDFQNWTVIRHGSSRTQAQSDLSLDDLTNAKRSSSTPDLKTRNSSSENLAEVNPKKGARLSRESIRILKAWLNSHSAHPYPTDEEKDSLKQQTGLNKTQITNWLANARRRGKVRPPRSTSPAPQHYANGIDIPRRPNTPSLQEMNPLERWKNSPPENEPASVTAIAKAVSSSTFSSGRDSPYLSNGHTDDGSARSLFNASSASSLGTSHSSGGSFASAFSQKSRGSFGSFNSFNNRGRRRRRRQAPKPVKNTNTFVMAPRTFQCTFCTESFKTKHDWQRHEKSLHLSLERWICSPKGSVQFSAELHAPACVYCGIANPPEGHAEQHNHSSCAERSLEERTFYRKDHLRQHLNLVHDAKFQAWSMDDWRVATPEIRSRCGFCGIVMDSWSKRVDHLAEHFKGGKSMADWKGDWGFEHKVLELVENGMPPYLIHEERNTMAPFEASNQDAINAGKTLEDKVKLDLVNYINEHVLAGGVPTDEDLLAEARKTVLKEEALIDFPSDVEMSWFRDLIMYSGEMPQRRASGIDLLKSSDMPEILWATKMERLNSTKKTMTDLSNISCLKERRLVEYVKARQALGLTPVDSELQVQACKILDEIEVTSNYKCKGAVQWFKYLITTSPTWLTDFRRRAVLPRSDQMANELVRSSDSTTIDYGIHNYHRLERELIQFVEEQRKAGYTPTDEDLQRTARMIIFESDDPWNQTAADDPAFLHVFKSQNGLAPIMEEDEYLPEPTVVGALGLSLLSYAKSSPPSQPHSSPSPPSLHWDLENTGIGFPSPVSGSCNSTGRNSKQNSTPVVTPIPEDLIQTSSINQPSTNTNPTQPLRYFLNDANCYGRLVRELTRFVTACMSPNNPTQHVPSDAEMQNQARWVIYDDDDPWNQTAADNAEWLTRFKRDVGILPATSGPGLPFNATSWQVSSGGSGYSPPYIMPKQDAKLQEYDEDLDVRMNGTVFYKVSKETAAKYVKGISQRYQPPAQVFCSRELERSLVQMVAQGMATGVLPTDDELRAKAREVLGVEHTAADDVQLLEKFKALQGISTQNPTGPVEDYTLPNFTNDVNMLNAFDENLGTMDISSFPLGNMSATETASCAPDFQSFEFGNLSTSISPITPINMELEAADNFSSAKASCPQIGDTHSMSVGRSMEIDDAELSYADFHRVQSATASPLRRRASERLASGTWNGSPW
ncbi:hypothetical protein B0O99DRAFT_540804 [Bisporella sp. PMI_857]|nr:hypothetical protein B0O99DRAFT_540804 [Bisporella sp. PMI_857]